jgi:rhodanese-related sulfurtransferase
MIKKKEDFVILDVRTPQEQSIVGSTWKNTLNIPMHEVFKPENLSKIPKDKKVVVVCHSGERAWAVVTGLRAAGFNNVYHFKGGMKELADKGCKECDRYCEVNSLGRALALPLFKPKINWQFYHYANRRFGKIFVASPYCVQSLFV